MNFDYLALKNGFNRTARSYQAAARLAKLSGEQLLERLQYIKCKPNKILDLGAGVGSFSSLLAKRYPKAHIIACDLSETRMQFARRHKPWFRKISYCSANFQQLPFDRDSFDLIFSNQSLYWASDLKQATTEMARVLKPDGVLLFSSLGPDTLQELRSRFATLDTSPHVNIFLDMHDVGDAILAAGFRDPVMDVERLQLPYASLAGLIAELRALGETNYHCERNKSLSAKHLRHLLQQPAPLRVSYEVIYGHAWGGQLRQAHDEATGEVRVSLDSLLRRSAS